MTNAERKRLICKCIYHSPATLYQIIQIPLTSICNKCEKVRSYGLQSWDKDTLILLIQFAYGKI